MLQCPKCAIDFDDVSLLDSGCPQCGGPVRWRTGVEQVSADARAAFPTIITREGASAAGRSQTDEAGPTSKTRVEARRTLPDDLATNPNRQTDVSVLNAIDDLIEQVSASQATVVKPSSPVQEKAKTRPAPLAAIPHSKTALAERAKLSRVGNPDILETINPRDLTPEQLQTLQTMWRESTRENSSPRMTIKSAASATVTCASLVIQPRDVRRPADNDSDKADYQLLDVVGEGGVGVVYSARQASIDRVVALKMLKQEITADASHRDKFLSEAVVTGELDHPNIVPIYDLGSNNQGDLFYSMKLVRGTPWNAVIAQKSRTENLSILLRVADAVAFAHARGVVHRDLKPENVMLGDFGEVLVMDWGIAISTSLHAKTEELGSGACMGGTPAYMAPEMATGPISKIGVPSDVYLLGATLFEITAGCPPHDGENVMDCLRSAAQNEIKTTTKSGELIEIAYRAMATDPQERYESVPVFQEAIRQYQSHSESIVLVSRAEQDLKAAEASKDYQLYARTMFAYQEALALWSDNAKARTGLETARVSYAHCASVKGDYDLGLSLLDEDKPLHRPLCDQMKKSLREREARQERLKRGRRLVKALCMLIFLVVSSFSIFVAMQRRELALNYAALQLQTNRLAKSESNLKHQTKRLRLSQADLTMKTTELTKSEAELRSQKDELVRSTSEAVQAKRSAIASREEARYESYLAQIGLAAAKVQENAFQVAVKILNSYQDSPLRHWEWGRLRYFEGLSSQTFDYPEEVECVAAWGEGQILAVGRQNGVVHVRRRRAGRENWDEQQLQTKGSRVFDLAFSPDGRFLATATDAASAFVTLWDLKSGRPVEGWMPLEQQHQQPVTCLTFSHDGQLLLTGSLDGAARIWDAKTGNWIATLERHHEAVRDVAIAKDRTMIVTVSEDGSAVVWKDDDGDWSDIVWTDQFENKKTNKLAPRFMEHAGPVYCVAFSPDGQRVATAGLDKQILVWNPRELKDFPFTSVLDQLNQEGRTKPAPVRYTALHGHAAAVKSVAFSPGDGALIVSASSDNTIKLWDANSGDVKETLRGHSQAVSSCVFVSSRTGNLIVFSGGRDGEAKIWHVNQYDEQMVVQAKVLSGHDDAVMHASFAPGSDGGLRIVTGGREGEAHIWELDPTNREREPAVKVLQEGHEFLIAAAKFLPDGKSLLTAAMDNSVRVWDALTGAQQLAITNTGQRVAIAVSQDGRWLLTGGDHGNAQLWDLRAMRSAEESRPPVANLPQQEGVTVTAVAISPQTAGPLQLLVCDDSGGCWLWSLEETLQHSPPTLTRRRHFAHDESVVAAGFLPNGQPVTASRDGAIGVWDPENGQAARRMIGPDAVLAMALSGDGSTLIASYSDGSVVQWDPQQAKEVRRFARIRGGPQTIAGNLRRLMSKQGLNLDMLQQKTRLPMPWLASLRAGRLVGETVFGKARSEESPDKLPADSMQRLADALNVSVERLHQPLATNADVSADRRFAALTYSEEGAVRLWDLSTGQETEPEQPFRWSPNDVGGAVSAAVLSNDLSQLLLVGGQSARLWNLRAGAEEMSYSPHRAVSFASFSQDGRFVVTASWDATAKIWDTQSGKAIAKLINGNSRALNSAVFSPDGSFLLTAGDDGRVVLWRWDSNTRDAPRPKLLVQHESGAQCAVFSPHGDYFLTAFQDGSATIWDARTQRALRQLNGQPSPINCAAFSRDGRWLATGCRDQRARIWSVASGDLLGILEGHTAQVNTVAFSPDGRRVLTGGDDHTIKLWDTRRAMSEDKSAAMLQEVLTLTGHREDVTCVAFSPSGQHVLSSSKDGTAILWPSVYIPPSLHFSPDAVESDHADAWSYLDPKVVAVAPNTGSFADASLTVDLIDADNDWQLRLKSIPPQDAASDLLDAAADQVVLTSSQELSYRFPRDAAPIVFGQLAFDAETGRLVFHFNDRATILMIQQTLRQIQYRYAGSPDAPSRAGVRVVLSHTNGKTTTALKQLRHSPPGETSDREEIREAASSGAYEASRG